MGEAKDKLRALADMGQKVREVETAKSAMQAYETLHGTPRVRAGRLRNAVVFESIPFITTSVILMGIGVYRLYMGWGHKTQIAGVVWFLSACALVWISTFVHGLWLLPREREFLAELPFATTGYLENLQEIPHHRAQIRVVVTMRRKPSESTFALLSKLTESIGATFDLDEKKSEVTISPKGATSNEGKWGPTNAPLRRAQRRVVEMLLLPLHANATVVSAAFSR